MDEPEFVEQADPEEVFGALSDDTRIATLRALWDADGPLPFSDLREAVGMRDSGQFNYHLDKLVGQFVTRTDDGYELTRAGIEINGAIETGSYTVEATLEPIDLEDPCPTCGSVRTLFYEDETVRVECESCPVGARFGVPPSVFADCDRESLPQVAEQYLQATTRRLRDGFCSFCDGHVAATVGAVPDFVEDLGEVPDDAPEEFVDRAPEFPLIRYECDWCGATPSDGLRSALRSHPAVVSFYHEHGIDIRDLPAWNVGVIDPDRERVRQRDPFRAAATFEAGDESLTLVVDDALDVVAVERDRNG